jgi:hypothetical protein
MAGPIPSWRGLSIRRSHLGIAASMIVKGFGRLPKYWLISHSRLPHRAASSGVVVNHLPSKLPTVGRNIPDFTMSSTSSGLTARYKRTHSSSSCRAACRAPCATAAPPPARSSAAFSIPTPSPPSARGSEAKPSISSAIWATPALASRALRNAKPSGAEEGYRKATRPLATTDTVCRKLKTFKAPSSFGRTE